MWSPLRVSVTPSHLVEWKRNLMAHGDTWEEKWRGKRRMLWVVSSFQFDSEQSIQCYYNRSPLTLTRRKPVLDWTDNPTDINGLVRFAGRPNLVSARVPSHPIFTLLQMECHISHSRRNNNTLSQNVIKVSQKMWKQNTQEGGHDLPITHSLYCTMCIETTGVWILIYWHMS